MAQEIENLGRIGNIRSLVMCQTLNSLNSLISLKKTIREIATSLSALAMTIHKLL